ncbi:MAG: alpha/beta hydrolase [Hyphomonadaceae bacterium]|nr:alpha/beta hydrolase [Hyphomonadaceae bacterium]
MAEVIFPGPAGRAEGRYMEPKREGAPIALILHGHPRAGGSMQDRVTVQLYKLFCDFDFAVMRFNFRGIGRSQGVFDNGMGELSDAASALDYLQSLNPNAEQCWVGGFSFGAWIGLQLLMRRPEIDGFIAAAPPANHYDLSFLAPCPASGLIVYGNRDGVTTAQDMERVIARIRTQKNIKVDSAAIDGADHFFRDYSDKSKDHLAEVEQHARAYLERRLRPQAEPPAKPERGRGRK